MEIRLSEIANLKLNKEEPRTRKNISKFVLYWLFEYAIGGLGIDSTDELYSHIKQAFMEEITGQEFKMYCRCNDEMNRLLVLLPVSERRKFDFNEWNQFMEQTTWECGQDENVIVVRGHRFISRKEFLHLAKIDDMYYAQCYDDESDECFKTLGADESSAKYKTRNLMPYHFSTHAKHINDNRIMTISDKEFFSNPEMQQADEEQRVAIQKDMEHNLVILAGAGSGKTRTLVSRLAYLHMVKGIPLDKILLLTFTKNAANEMRSKALNIMKPVYSKYDIDSPLEINARTIDSFFYRIIDQNYLMLGFTDKPAWRVEDDEQTLNDSLSLLDEVVQKNQLQGIFSFYYEKDGLTPNKNFSFLLRELDFYASGLQSNVAGIDILLKFYIDKQISMNTILGYNYATVLLKNKICEPYSVLKEEIESRYTCILMDEFQDINVKQNETFEPFYHGPIHFTFAGDDDQSIYGFRGSDNVILQQIVKEKDSDTVYLMTNYRNNPNIVEAGNVILRTIRNRAKNDRVIRPARENGSKIRVMAYDKNYNQVAAEVERLIQNGYKSEEICILIRGGKERREGLMNALRGMNIPVKDMSRQFVISSYYKLMKALVCVLADYDVIGACKVIKSLACLDTAKENSDYDIEQMLLGKIPAEGNMVTIKEIADEMRLNYCSSLAEIIYRFSLKASEVFMHLSNERLDDDAVNFFELYCKNNDAPWPVTHEQLSSLFKGFEHEVKKNGKYGYSTMDGVCISTIHQSKGLEYKVVIITGLNAGEYPDTRKIDDEYNRKVKQLNALSGARANYYELKKSVSSELYGLILKQTDIQNRDVEYYKQLREFNKEIKDSRSEMLNLSADGIQDYMDLYQENIVFIDNQYREQSMEIWKKLALHGEQIERNNKQLKLLEENTAEYQELSRMLEQEKSVISELTLQFDAVKAKQEKFLHAVSALREYYNICLKAAGLLADMKKADDIEKYKEKLIETKEKQVNEERRIYYVALTRAREILYLCYEQGEKQSEFITVLPEKIKSSYISMTKEQQREFDRVRKALKNDMELEQINDSAVDAKVDVLVGNDFFKEEIDKKIAEYENHHPIYKSVPGEVQDCLHKALGLQFLGEMTETDFTSEVAHNIQRAAEEWLIYCCGAAAKPYRAKDRKEAQRIARIVRQNADKCLTHKPSEEYIIQLLTQEDNMVNLMKNLKSAGIMHYIVRSKEIKLSSGADESWKMKRLKGSAGQFLVAVIDIANMRNSLIHPEQNSWEKDNILLLLKNIEVLFNSGV